MSVPWPVRWRSEQNQIQNICHQLANIIINGKYYRFFYVVIVVRLIYTKLIHVFIFYKDENTYNNLCRDWHHEGVILAVANGYVDQYVQTHYVAGEINPGYALLIRESLMRLLGSKSKI